MTGDINPIGRAFEPYAVGGLTLLGFAGAALAAMVSTIRKEKPTQGIVRVIESFVLAWSGGAIARLFVSYLLAWGHDSPVARLFIGWTFFFWPGFIDTIPTAYGSPLFDANAYLLMATIVGGIAGALDGAFQIHNWTGLGILTFLADVTWGLSGTTTACILHVYNLCVRAGHGLEKRQSAHRYRSGFRAASFVPFVFGSVISQSIARSRGGGIVEYHSFHPRYPRLRQLVTCHRVFGPFFTLSYLGWMIAWLPAGLAAGLVSVDFGVGTAALWSLYLNNPWQAVNLGNAWGSETDAGFLAMSARGIYGFGTFFAIITMICVTAAARLAWFAWD